jgi:predicted alpha/beta superfamily hydrolase
MKDRSSSTTSSGGTEDTSYNFSGYVGSLEEKYTSSTRLAAGIQEMQLSWSALPDEWGHFVDFQEEPYESWVGAFLDRHVQKRKHYNDK